MRPLEILDNLFFIERGYLNGNHFVYKAKNPVLIDSAYISGFDETASLIQAVGVDLSRVKLIINTHCHCDHVGGNKMIQEQSGCEIAMHKYGKHFIDRHDDWSTWWRYFAQEADFFDCAQALHDGDTLAVGPHQFQVIHTPGHASDGIVLYHKQDKILISSDTLWENDMAAINVRIEGSTALLKMQESLARIESLEVEMVYPGHGQPFTNFQQAVARSKKRINNFMNNRQLIGLDLLKKLIVYTLMMHESVNMESFFPQLMGTYWYKETVDLYFDNDYAGAYHNVMENFIKRGIVQQKHGQLLTTVKP